MSREWPKEYSREDPEGWESLTLKKGQVIEAEIPVSTDLTKGDAPAAFLVQRVSINVNGDLVLEARSLGAGEPELARSLSSTFNRRRGLIHLCGADCIGEGDFALHIGSLKVYEYADFEADYVSAHYKRAAAKWMTEDLSELEDPGTRLDITGETIGEVGDTEGDKPLSGEPPGAAAKPAARKARRPTVSSPGPAVDPRRKEGVRRDGGLKEVDREALRERLARVKARVAGGTAEEPLRSAGEVPGEPDAPSPEESMSPGYSPSPFQDRLEDGTRLRAPGDLALAAGTEKKQKDRGRREDKKDTGHRKDRKKEQAKETQLVAIRDGSTRNLQRQLLERAADAAARKAKENKAEKKRSKKKDASSKLLKILTGQKDKKDKKERKKKRKKRKKELDPYGRNQEEKDSPSSSSPMGSSGPGSGSSSEEESSSASEKLEAPLKRRSKEKPGSVLALLVEHARQQLDQTSKVTLSPGSKENMTVGVKLSSYFAIVLRPQLGQMSAAVRELHMLANGMDMLRQGDLDVLGDLLASRFMSIHQSIIDGGWATARHLELLPLEDNSAAGNAVVLEARKHAKMAARLANQDLWTGGGGGKAKGGRGRNQSWGDSPWQAPDNGKGKGKKGGKGKGKYKNAWGASHGGEGDGAAGKNKEKVPEK